MSTTKAQELRTIANEIREIAPRLTETRHLYEAVRLLDEVAEESEQEQRA